MKAYDEYLKKKSDPKSSFLVKDLWFLSNELLNTVRKKAGKPLRSPGENPYLTHADREEGGGA